MEINKNQIKARQAINIIDELAKENTQNEIIDNQRHVVKALNELTALRKENKSLQEELYNKSPRCCKCEIFISERSIVCRSCENKKG